MIKPGTVTNEVLYFHLMEIKLMLSVIGGALGLELPLSIVMISQVVERVKNGVAPVSSLKAIMDSVGDSNIPDELLVEINKIIDEKGTSNGAKESN